MNDSELRDILDFAVEAAQLAGAFTLGYFNADTPHELKADNTPVTVADRGAEELLRKRIEAAYPTHGILGEEFGEKSGREPARWIIDPIDGTFSFISGVPLYSVLVGYEWQGEMLARRDSYARAARDSVCRPGARLLVERPASACFWSCRPRASTNVRH